MVSPFAFDGGWTLADGNCDAGIDFLIDLVPSNIPDNLRSTGSEIIKREHWWMTTRTVQPMTSRRGFSTVSPRGFLLDMGET